MARFVVALLLLGLATTVRAEDDALKHALALEAAIQQAAERAESSVACVLVSRSEAYEKFNSPRDRVDVRAGRLGGFTPPPDPGFGRQNAEQDLIKRLNLAAPEAVPDSYGSAVVIDEGQALLLTNLHVIRDATKVYVRLPGGHGSYANIHAYDERSDLAVLRLINPPPNLKALRMGDGDKLKKGQFVLAISNPFAVGFRDGSPSVTWGMLSNIRRRLPGEPNEGQQRRPRLHYYPVLLQTSIRLPPGASGGALLDLQGNWIGLTTSLAGVVGGEDLGGYAIPLDTRMKRIIDTLRRGEEVEYGFLGISQQAVPRDGVGLWSPTPGGPAARAGMQHGDRIVSVDGVDVNDPDDLLFGISAALAGTRVRMIVVRNNRRVELYPVLAKTSWPSNLPIVAANRPEPVHGLRVDYTSVLAISGTAQRSIAAGVLVREVEENSPAARADLKPDKDIIVSVNGRMVNTPREFYDAARPANGTIDLVLEDGRRVRLP